MHEEDYTEKLQPRKILLKSSLYKSLYIQKMSADKRQFCTKHSLTIISLAKRKLTQNFSKNSHISSPLVITFHDII